ncbi:hypothetical protein NPIL_151 [Nephila pilipes]|uniref:Uncharacterized protein n=1 Tax=Nephila pilipes TaxID=299642 RepID=A0A8X6UQQ2_NEPPI|nr:hypothetical protein NPIL_151 [Nephila pilipes]
MKENTEKTIVQLFTMSQLEPQINLFYKGIPLHQKVLQPNVTPNSLRSPSMLWKNTRNHDEEKSAIHEAAKQLPVLNLPARKVVFFINSQAVISDLSSNNPTDCPRIIQCHKEMADLITSGRAP